MTTTATNNQGTTNTNGSTNGKSARPLTAVDAISKITKVLDQLTPGDRKRVMAFINETGE